jgi:hypothetical protein
MTATTNTTGAQANAGAAQATATGGEANQTTTGATTKAPGGSPFRGKPSPPPQGGPGNLLPGSYVEYYTLRRNLDPSLLNVMDAFQSTAPNDPQVAIKTHVELNADLISTGIQHITVT